MTFLEPWSRLLHVVVLSRVASQLRSTRCRTASWSRSSISRARKRGVVVRQIRPRLGAHCRVREVEETTRFRKLRAGSVCLFVLAGACRPGRLTSNDTKSIEGFQQAA